MALVVPNQAEAIMLKAALNHTAPQNLTLKLFSSNTTPAETDTELTYTEVSGGGYAAISLTATDWTFTEGAPSEASHLQKTFSFTGSVGNVYGYYVVQATSGKLMWAERFTDGPYNIQNNGDAVKITLKITLE